MVNSAGYSPDGQRIIATSSDGIIQVYTTDMDELLEIAKSRVTRQLTKTLQKGINLLYSGQQMFNGVQLNGMEKQMRRVAYLSVLLPLLTMSLWTQEEENQEPVVSNPIAKQLDYEHVLISYQVEDGDGDLTPMST